jgi:hypothetical protein
MKLQRHYHRRRPQQATAGGAAYAVLLLLLLALLPLLQLPGVAKADADAAAAAAAVSRQGKLVRRMLEEALPDDDDDDDSNNSNNHDNNHNSNNYNNSPWLIPYAIQYVGCANVVTVSGNGRLVANGVVRFRLCPKDDACTECPNGGEYVVQMHTFLDAYTEHMLTEAERECENVREACYCEESANDVVRRQCENECYASAGHEDCIEREGQEAFQAQRYLECTGAWTRGKNERGRRDGYGRRRRRRRRRTRAIHSHEPSLFVPFLLRRAVPGRRQR